MSKTAPQGLTIERMFGVEVWAVEMAPHVPAWVRLVVAHECKELSPVPSNEEWPLTEDGWHRMRFPSGTLIGDIERCAEGAVGDPNNEEYPYRIVRTKA